MMIGSSRTLTGLRPWPRTAVNRLPAGQHRVIAQLLTLGFWLVLGMFFFMIAVPNYAEIKPKGLPNIAPARLLRFALIGMTLVVLLVKPWRVSMFHFPDENARRIRNMIALFFVWYLFNAIVLQPQAGPSLDAIKNIVLPSWLMFTFAAIYVRNPNQVRNVIRVLALATVVVLVAIALEYVLRRNVFDGIVSAEGWAQTAFVDQSRDGTYRAKGTFQHPIINAQYLVSVGLMFSALGLFTRRGWRSVAWLGMGLLSMAFVYFSGTRSGMLFGGLFFGLMVLVKFFMVVREMRNQLLAAVLKLQLIWIPVLLGGVFFWVRSLVLGRTAAEFDSTSARLSMIERGIPAILQSPLLGYGPGEGAKIAGFRGYFGIYFIDNVYLSYALDFGLLHALLFMAVLALSIWRLWPRADELRLGGDEAALRLGVALALLATSAFLVTHASGELHEFTFGLIGMSMALSSRRPPAWYAQRSAMLRRT